MSAARHFFSRGTFSDAELAEDIKQDIKAARGAQKDLKAAGQYGVANLMGQAVDEHLDELNDVKAGRWNPFHR